MTNKKTTPNPKTEELKAARKAEQAQKAAARQQQLQAQQRFLEFKEAADQQELKARYNKAHYETMHYYLAARDITSTFNKAVEEDMNKREAMIQEGQKAQAEQDIPVEAAAPLEKLAEAIDTGNVDNWIKENSTNGKETLADILADSE